MSEAESPRSLFSNSNVLHRISYLTFARAVQVLVPIMIYPLLVSRLGTESLGRVLFWASLATFVSSVAALNLDSIASRGVSRAASRNELETAILAPLRIKGITGCLALLVWLLIATISSESSSDFILIFFCAYPFLNNLAIPNYYFIGAGEFKLNFVTVLIDKVVFVLVVLLFLTSEADLLALPMAYLLGLALASSFSLSMIARKRKVQIRNVFRVPVRGLVTLAPVLTLGKLTQFHTTAARFVVGILFGYSTVVLYDIAEKLTNLAKMPIVTIGQALFSLMGRANVNYIVLWGALSVIAVGEYSVIGLMSGKLSNYFLSGGNSSELVWTMERLTLVIFFIPLLVAFGSNFIVKYGDVKLYGRLLLISNLINVSALLSLFAFGALSFGVFIILVISSEGLLALLCGFNFLRQYFARENDFDRQ